MPEKWGWPLQNAERGDTPIRTIAKRLAFMWTSWQRIEKLIREAVEEEGWTPPKGRSLPPPKRSTKRTKVC